MTGRIEKTVFISYRRTNLSWALAIYQHLTSQGYDVFFDYLSIPSGDFENIIVENIKGRAHFVVILTPSALERCHEPGDWLRREIETAMDEKRNIVPLMLESFDFGSPATVKALTGKLDNLKKYNALRVPSEYFFEAMDRLRNQFLSVSLDAVVLPISENTKQVTEEHQFAARVAEQVRQEELTAQEAYERGFRSFLENNFDESIRLYSQAIQLEDDFYAAISGRGAAYSAKGELDHAIDDYNAAIQVAHRMGDQEKIISTLIRLGAIEFQRRDYERGREYLTDALALADKINDRSRMSLIFNNLAIAASYKGDYSQAEQYLSNGLSIARETGQKQMTAYLLTSFGEIVLKKGDVTQAGKYLQEASKIARDIGSDWILGYILNNLGDLHLKQDNIELASDAFIEALKISQSNAKDDLVGRALYGLAQVALALGNTDEAYNRGQESLSMLPIGSEEAVQVRSWLGGLLRTKT